MTEPVRGRLFQKVLVPLVHGWEGAASLRTASVIASGRNVLLAGIVGIPAEDSLSKGALPARQMRKTLQEKSAKLGFRNLEMIQVSENPWQELIKIIQREKPSLLIMEDAYMSAFGVTLGDALRNLPCDVVVACGHIPERIRKVLVPIRGGPSAELALRLGLSVARHTKAAMNTLHILPKYDSNSHDIPFRGIERVLKNLPEVKAKQVRTDDPARAILSTSKGHDLMIMGATAKPLKTRIGLGDIAG